MRPTPYIGITGFATPQEVHEAKDAYGETTAARGPVGTAPPLMYGIITSGGMFARPAERGRIRVALDDLADVMHQVPRDGICALHHHSYAMERQEEELTSLLERTYERGVDLVQINNTWPSPDMMLRLKERFSPLGFVLQFPPAALEKGVEDVASRAADYVDTAMYTLVDPSQGAGKEFDPVFAAEVMAAVQGTLPRTTMGVAGGLSGENVYRKVAAVRSRFSRPFAIDAEGRLRTEDWHRIDPCAMRSYLSGALRAFTQE